MKKKIKLLRTKALIQLFFLILLLFSAACTNDQPYLEGKVLYENHCSSCHGKNGEGLELLIPQLKNSDMMLKAGSGVACWIRNGMNGKIWVNGKEFEGEMPRNKILSNVEITNVVNYIQNAWGNKHRFITLEEINSTLDKCSNK